MDVDRKPTASRECSMRSRIDRLEHRCALLWSREPSEVDGSRESTLRQLADLERRLASIAVRTIATPDRPELDRELRRCEKDLAILAGNWIEQPAA